MGEQPDSFSQAHRGSLPFSSLPALQFGVPLWGTHSLGQGQCRILQDEGLGSTTRPGALEIAPSLVPSPLQPKLNGSSHPSARLQRSLWVPSNPILCLPLDIPHCSCGSPAGRESAPGQNSSGGDTPAFLQQVQLNPTETFFEHIYNDLSSSRAHPAHSSRVLGGVCSS